MPATDSSIPYVIRGEERRVRRGRAGADRAAWTRPLSQGYELDQNSELSRLIARKPGLKELVIVSAQIEKSVHSSTPGQTK